MNTPTATIDEALAPDLQEFVRQHRTDDVRTLALRAPRGAEFNVTLALEQIAGWQTARRKLPTWAACDGVVYPPHLSMEQCSSEATARYKAAVAERLVAGRDKDGTSMTDLTGGLGIDFSFLAPLFGRATYVERNAWLCRLARHNLPLLGLAGAGVVEGGAEERLAAMEPVTMLFLDPARRDSNGGKTVAMADCSPDVTALRPLLLRKAATVVVKLSPMLDWHKAVADMEGSVAEVHIVGTGGECKELLLVADGGTHAAVEVTCWADGRTFTFAADGTEAALPPVAPAEELLAVGEAEGGNAAKEGGAAANERGAAANERGNAARKRGTAAMEGGTAATEDGAAEGCPSPVCLCEPDATLMKAGCFGLVAARYGLRAVGRNSHLFVGPDPGEAFPGRRFRLTACSTMNRRSLRAALKGVERANVAVRNLPLTADALRRKLGLKDGGEVYVFGTTLADGTHAVLVCKRF